MSLALRRGLPAGCPTFSPWGDVQHAEDCGNGLFIVSTAGHGGMFVPAELNAKIPAIFRHGPGWYEEDCDIAIPFYFLEDHFKGMRREAARKSLRNWHWKEWEKHFKEDIPLAEAPIKACEVFKRENADKLLTVSAWGDWHEKVPKGMVGVCATPGGCREPESVHYEKWFLIPSDEYASRVNNPAGCIVIDPSRHQKWDGPYA